MTHNVTEKKLCMYDMCTKRIRLRGGFKVPGPTDAFLETKALDEAGSGFRLSVPKT